MRTKAKTASQTNTLLFKCADKYCSACAAKNECTFATRNTKF